MKSRLLALVGPTASGKSSMAVEVARAIGGIEILSCDSMGVYRGLDIAADKPANTEGIPHHLFDLAGPDEEFTAVQYRDFARLTIAEVQSRGALPMLVGGSGLWYRAVVDDLEFAPADPEVRKRLSDADPAELYSRLLAADPESARRIGTSNPRRLLRAAEILELTGRPPGELRTTWEKRDGPYLLAVAALTWDSDELKRRATQRVYDELAAGLIEEVQAILVHGLSRTARQALGVKELIEHIEGRLSFEEARELLVRNTRRFIRRQLSWFRADPRIVWINASELGWNGAASKIRTLFEEPSSHRRLRLH